MNGYLEKKDYLKLLELLETRMIIKEDFYKLLDFKKDKLRSFFKIIEIEGLEEKNELIKKILDDSDKVYKVYTVLKNNPDLRNNIEKRNYVIDNIKNLNIDSIIKLIRYDFIFNDKDLLKKLIGYKKIGRFYALPPLENIDSYLLEEIKDNLELYEDASKNKYISMALNLPKNEYVREFIKLIKYKTCTDNPKWFEYIQECFKMNEEFNIEYVSTIIEDLEETNKVDIVNKLLEKLDKTVDLKTSQISNISKLLGKTTEKNIKEAKLMVFNRLINNLYRIPKDYMEDDKKFNYLMKKITLPEEEFMIHLNNAPLFTNDESLCKEGSEIYNTIINCKDQDTMRALLKGLSTSLAPDMDIEFIKKCITDKNTNPEVYITNLAMDKGNVEYIKKTNPQLLLERFSADFIEYMSTHPDLTLEEILSQKQVIQDTMPQFKNGSYVIDIPVDGTNTETKFANKVKRIFKK